MKPSRTISKFIAVFLLCVCFVSIIPKIFFHNIIADHTDTPVCRHIQTNGDCVHQQGFHCGFDDLVVNLPYLYVRTGITIQPPQFYISHASNISVSLSKSILFHSESRGPPSGIAFLYCVSQLY